MTDKQMAIAELQQWLRNISKSKDDSPAIIPDGIYSEETRLAVEDFQRERGLAVTGRVDYELWEAIRLADRLVTLEGEAPAQVAPIKNEDLPLVRGMNNPFTDTLKLMLGRVADAYKNFTPVDEEGFGAQTEEAVKKWQKTATLEQTGKADKATWNSLAAFYLM